MIKTDQESNIPNVNLQFRVELHPPLRNLPRPLRTPTSDREADAPVFETKTIAVSVTPNIQ